MESPMRSWLMSKVPDWDDDTMCAARFKALTGQRADWEARFLFWRDLVIDLARHLNVLVLDTHAVQHSWFLRGGLTPLCINQVLLEMLKRGDLQNLDNYQETKSTSSWFWERIWGGLVLSSSTMYLTNDSIAGRLLVKILMHERIMAVTESVSENCWTASCVITVEHMINLCGGEEEASIVRQELIRTKRGRTVVIEGNPNIKGFKISLSQECVSDVSKLDSYMLHLYWTLERLGAQMGVLENAYNRSKHAAIKALKQDRTTAKKHVQSMHTIAASKVKCTEFQGKIQEVLAFISQAEMTKQVSEALKMGTSAMKEYTISLEDIEACLHDLDEAISDHQEVASVLGSGTLEESEVDDFESELADLELEVFGEKIYTPVVAVEKIGGDTLPKPPVTSLGAIEHGLKSLELA